MRSLHEHPLRHDSRKQAFGIAGGEIYYGDGICEPQEKKAF